MFGRDPARCLGQSRAGAVALLSQSETLVAQTAAAHHAHYHAAIADLCDGNVCHAFLGGQLLYLDSHHLTPAGAMLVGQGLARTMPGGR
jgi:hypothetical protein